MRTRPFEVVVAVMVVVVAFGSSACGDDGENGGWQGSVGTPTSGARDGGRDAARDGDPPVELEGEVTFAGRADVVSSGAAAMLPVTLDDERFSPTYVKAAPGAKVRVRLENRGDRPHTFTIADPKVDVEVEPAGSTEVEVQLPSTGVVRFACRFHQSSGMQGAFYFAEGETASPAAGYPGPDY
ncbi:MAG TPA: cupredoxin domain-containing protein [Acidimicrobiales bacterium]